jgi:hypothetical protein
MSGLLTWHGGHNWEGSPEIRASKKGQYECGPGIYSTTNLSTASRYSKGGGRIIQFTIDPEVTWLENVKIPFDDALAFVKKSHHIGKRRILQDDLQRCYELRDHIRFSGMLPLAVLVNLAVNNNCLSGKASPELAEFLTANGAQASLHRSSGDEDWVIIFDPKAITSFDIKSSKDIDWSEDRLPSISAQLEALRAPAPSM